MSTKRQINERDRLIFSFIGKYGCANAKQIHGAVFTVNEKTGRVPTEARCRDRLTQLIRSGYVKTELVKARGKTERIYWIERKALMELDEDKRKTLEAGRPPEKEIAHTLSTVDVINAVSKAHEIRYFVHEHTLKSLKVREMLKFSDLEVGDALIDIAPSGNGNGYLSEGQTLIEIDGDYWGEKMRAKAQSLKASNMPVLYVCSSYERLSYVKSRMQADNVKVFHIAEL